MQIEYKASDEVRNVIASLGRTEDVRFSPNNRRLAITAFRENAVGLFDVEITNDGGRKGITLSRAVMCTASCLDYPHGLDFIDDDTLVVVSRGGNVPILRLPSGEIPGPTCEATPVQILKAEDMPALAIPGSVGVFPSPRPPYEFVICNSGGNTVTRHVVDGASASCSVLLQKWLHIPDSVSISADQRWIAISNHDSHNVMIYRNQPGLNKDSDPDGILRSVVYPHGLRFTADGRHIVVADAGAPYIHVYASKVDGWHGVHNPVASVRVMDQATYQAGRRNPKEGGPKGIDLDKSMNVLVATCEGQPLAFFDLPAILSSASARPRVMELSYELHLLEEMFDTQAKAVAAEHRAAYEVSRAEKFKAKAAKAKAKRKAAGAKGAVRRIAAPISRIYTAFKRPT